MTHELSGPRLSLLAQCPRACSAHARGLEAAPKTEVMRRHMWRGQVDADFYYRVLKEEHGARAVRREVKIPWPLGQGHADFWVPAKKLLVELKSGRKPDVDVAARQMRLYRRFFPRAEHGVVAMLNPMTLDIERIPIRLNDSEVELIDAEVEAVRVSLAGGEPPACRLGSSPRTCTCDYKQAAWADHDPEQEVYEPLPDWAKQRLLEVYEERKVAQAVLREAEAAWGD